MEQVTNSLRKYLSNAQNKISVARDLCQEIDRTFDQTGKIPDIELIKSVLKDTVICVSDAILEVEILRDPKYMDRELC